MARSCGGIAGSGKSGRGRSRSPRGAAAAATLTLCHSPAGSHRLDPPQTGPQFFLQPGGVDVLTARQRPDHYPFRSFQSVHQTASHVAQPPGQAVPLHGRTHRSRNDQPNLRRLGIFLVAAPRIDDEVSLHGSGSMPHRGIELSRPRHAVPRGKHRCDTGIGTKQSASGGLCDAGSTRLPAPPGCASAAGSRARGLGAGCSAGRSACPLPRLSPRCIWHRLPAGCVCRWNTIALTQPRRALCLAGSRRGPRCILRGSQPYRRLSGDCTRVRSGVRRVKPGRRGGRAHPGIQLVPHPPPWPASNSMKAWANVAERLALRGKTVSFGQCRFRLERRTTTKRGWRIGFLAR